MTEKDMKTPYDRNKKLSYQIMFWCFIGIIAMLIILASCEKVEDENNYICTTHFYEWKYLPGCRIWMWHYVDSVQLYGYTERDIRKYERYNTIDKHSADVYGDHIEWQDCTCIMKDK